jgi:hypothetical protein
MAWMAILIKRNAYMGDCSISPAQDRPQDSSPGCMLMKSKGNIYSQWIEQDIVIQKEEITTPGSGGETVYIPGKAIRSLRYKM